MTTEWDNTPWQGTSPPRTKALVPAVGVPVIKARVIEPTAIDLKAVVGANPWQTGIPLSALQDTPQKRAAAYLKAYKVGWFYKAGRKIADDFANLDWRLSDGDAETDSGPVEALPRPDLDIPFGALSPIDQLQRLLERPNPQQTGRQLRQKTRIRLDFAGTAFWYLENGEGGQTPTAIYGISPSRMWDARDRDGVLVGWVMDRDKPGGGVPFSADEILTFSMGGPDDDPWGVGVVEAVYAHVPLTHLMAQHIADVMSTGGRLAGMMWPKSRELGADEYQDAQRAWRNVSSDPNAARRLLIFPEPMEYAPGASTPKDIGIPELANLDRDQILTAFPLSPYQLGVPMPGGLNSAETRREDRRDYWEGTIHPRVTSYDETIQTSLVSRYEQAMGQTFDFLTEEPNLDDAPALLEKTAALRGLISVGFDPKEAITAVGLDHIRWNRLPPLLDPYAKPAEPAETDPTGGQRVVVRDNTPRDNTATQQTIVGKGREDVMGREIAGSRDRVRGFLLEQRDRVLAAIQKAAPAAKAARQGWVKADEPDWWDASAEDAALQAQLRQMYVQISRGALQVVADTQNRTVLRGPVDRVLESVLKTAGQRVGGINQTTLAALREALSEGVRRGYSIPQLVGGVPDEGFPGLRNLSIWDDTRAELIARTETMLAYNEAALRGYGEFGVKQVQAIDGDHDAQCAVRDGNVYSLDDALSITDHPNGTLDWIPISG